MDKVHPFLCGTQLKGKLKEGREKQQQIIYGQSNILSAF